jgi:predicted dehydrogenase
METKKVRIGFVGVGSMGQCAHLKNYVTVPDCEVVALAELKADLAAQVAARYGIAKVYASHEEMLKNEKLDALVASQPFARHGTLVPELLQAGIPVFTEKPLAGSIPMGEKIVETLKASGTWMMVGYHKRSDPATQAAKAEIDALKASGELGKMTYVRLLMPAGDYIAGGFNDLIRVTGPAPQLARDPADPAMDKETYALYIAFVNYYIHQVNLMRHLLGEPYALTYAAPSGVMWAGQSVGGTACTLEMSPYRTTVDWQESALVCFERGWVRIDLPAPLASNRPGRLTIFKDSGKTPPVTIEPQLPWVHAMRQQAMNFVAAVRGERAPVCTAEEALEDLKVARQYIKLWKGV